MLKSLTLGHKLRLFAGLLGYIKIVYHIVVKKQTLQIMVFCFCK